MELGKEDSTIGLRLLCSKFLPIILFHNSCEIVQLFPIIFRLFPKILIALTANVTYMNIHEHTDQAYTCKSTCTKTLNNTQ